MMIDAENEDDRDDDIFGDGDEEEVPDDSDDNLAGGDSYE